jgi:Undecaprenyl-phosphate glucose phosphotransferase
MNSRPRFQKAAQHTAVIHSDTLPTNAVFAARLSSFLGYVLAAEFLAVATSAYISSVFYYHFVLHTFPPINQYIPAALFIAMLFTMASAAFRHFSLAKRHRLDIFLWNGIGAVALAFSFFQTTIFLLKLTDGYSRGTFFSQLVGVSITVLVVRAIAHSVLKSAIASGRIQAPRAILIGHASDCARFTKRFNEDAINVVRSMSLPVDASSTNDSKGGASSNKLSSKMIEELRLLRPEYFIILATPDSHSAISEIVTTLSELPISLHVVPVWEDEFLPSAPRMELAGVSTIQLLHPPLSKFDRVAKRAFDLAAATVALILLSPLLLTVAIAIKLDSRGPIIFRQTRHGYNNESIRVFKFRSMTTCEDDGDFTQAVKNDPRVTRVGRILRSTNIDELPQILNVLIGEMSMIGPRPHPIALNETFANLISKYARRHTVKPGITGWAQVNGLRGETDTIEKMRKRVLYDLYYIDNWSFRLDLKIVLMTLFSRNAYTNAY